MFKIIKGLEGVSEDLFVRVNTSGSALAAVTRGNFFKLVFKKV